MDKRSLRRAVAAATAAGCRPVVAVLGAESARVEDALAGSGARITLNPAWKLGMGLSVRFGIETLDTIDVDAALLMVCDQPLVGPEALGRLCAAFRQAVDRPGAIAAAAYGGTVGVPAVFGRAHFPELCALPHGVGREAGARAASRVGYRSPAAGSGHRHRHARTVRTADGSVLMLFRL